MRRAAAPRRAHLQLVQLLLLAVGLRPAQCAYNVTVTTAQELQQALNNRSEAGLAEPVYVTVQEHLDLRQQPSSATADDGEMLDPVKRNLVVRVRSSRYNLISVQANGAINWSLAMSCGP